MVDTLVPEIVESLRKLIPEELVAFVISLLPVLECRGGMIASYLMGIPFWKAFLICYIGNMLPLPFIILFIRKIFDFLRRYKFFAKIIKRLEAKTERNKDKILRYESWGLLIFVAIPLPGTGGWTGAMMAGLLDMRFKRALPVLAVGVFIAGLIMSAVTYGIF